ncbi:hypothetical protein BDQ17DRAFT_403280 [Cyathus striatus]|nr:hypothetical protein BDQ17DRAFT_403280 [Cyathus striatus]
MVMPWRPICNARVIIFKRLKSKKASSHPVRTRGTAPEVYPTIVPPKAQDSANQSEGHQRYPYRQLHAIPFSRSPEDIIIRLSVIAHWITSNTTVVPIMRGFLSSFFSNLHKKWSWFPKPLRPERLEMVYFPAWIIEGELKANVICNGTNGKKIETEAIAHLVNTYIPGSDTKILSSVTLKHLRILGRIQGDSNKETAWGPKPVPFTDRLRTQFERPVTCLPFNIWPKRIVDLVKDRRPTVNVGNTSVQLMSLEPTMAVMFPILYPLYVVKYKSIVPGERRTYTLVVEATDTCERVFVETAS